MIEPSVSLPIAKPTRPRGRRGAGTRARLPPEPSSGTQGFFVVAAEPDVVQREGAEAELRDEDRAGLVEAPHDVRVGVGTRSW